jgi:hypothetical protein
MVLHQRAAALSEGRLCHRRWIGDRASVRRTSHRLILGGQVQRLSMEQRQDLRLGIRAWHEPHLAIHAYVQGELEVSLQSIIIVHLAATGQLPTQQERASHLFPGLPYMEETRLSVLEPFPENTIAPYAIRSQTHTNSS